MFIALALAFLEILTFDPATSEPTCTVECLWQENRNSCEEIAGCTWSPKNLPACTRNSTKIPCGTATREPSLACLQNGCIWENPVFPNDPWCFFPKQGLPETEECIEQCYADTEKTCVAKGCIWTEKRRPNCYRKSKSITCGIGATDQSCNSLNGCQWLNHTQKCIFVEKPQIFVNCHPDVNPTRKSCNARGCAWFFESVNPDGPNCVFKNNQSTYSIVDVETNTSQVVEATLRNFGTGPDIFGKPYEQLKLQVYPFYNSVGMLMLATGNALITAASPAISNSTEYDFSYNPDNFCFTVTRKFTGFKVFDTCGIPGFTLEEQYVQISTHLQTRHIYGFGELSHLRLKRDVGKWHNFTLWNRDRAPQPEIYEDYNLYGFHPFYLGLEPDGRAHGIFFPDTSATNVAIQPIPDVLTFRLVKDLASSTVAYLIWILGDSPDDVIEKYTTLIVGSPTLVPYWGLGYQLSRYGYSNLNAMRKTYDRNVQAGIPIDVVYADIDYMDRYRDFTVSRDRFAGLPAFANELHGNGSKIVLITDPGIDATQNLSYLAYAKGLAEDIFIKNSSGQYLTGRVWPGDTYFPDFNSYNAPDYWCELLKDFHARIPFDGIWYDMNEPSNLVHGSVNGCPVNPVNNPAYNPLADHGEDLTTFTICGDALVASGRTFYGHHAIYGLDETRVGYKAVQCAKPGLRPFLLSRSTAPSSGQYTAHWSGDIYSNFAGLRYSIVNMLEFGMFGIPWVGSDICGFHGDSTEELCIRWHQVGAFYPFARNHNDKNQKDQDPAVWSGEAQEIIRRWIRYRYGLLPFMYTKMVTAHLTGRPAVRPLFFSFPRDEIALDVDDQFLWGDEIMIAPVLEAGAVSRNVYFPQSLWYDFGKDFEQIDSPEGGKFRKMGMNLTETGVYYRGGSVIVTQIVRNTDRNTFDIRRNDFEIYVALNETQQAYGELFWDDGVSQPQETYKNGSHAHIVMSSSVSCDRPDGAVVFTTLTRNNSTTVFDGIRRYSKSRQEPDNADVEFIRVPNVSKICVLGALHRPTGFKIDGASVEGQIVAMGSGHFCIEDVKVDIGGEGVTVVSFR